MNEDKVMKTEEQYFKEAREREEKEAKKRERKWRNKIIDEISGWIYEKLKHEYIKLRLSKISYYNPASAGLVWSIFKSECMFCGLEYIYGHENCCDGCWEENKDKTLAELDDDE